MDAALCIGFGSSKHTEVGVLRDVYFVVAEVGTMAVDHALRIRGEKILRMEKFMKHNIEPLVCIFGDYTLHTLRMQATLSLPRIMISKCVRFSFWPNYVFKYFKSRSAIL